MLKTKIETFSNLKERNVSIYKAKIPQSSSLSKQENIEHCKSPNAG